MRSKKWMIAARAVLLVGALLLSTTALAGTLGYYNWSANTTGYVGEFTNSGSGGGVKANTVGASSIGVYGGATGSSAQGTRGYNSGAGYGLYGRSPTGTGVYGENNSATAGYGGFFKGFNGLKAYTSATNGYAGWFTATGGTGFGVRAQSSAATGYGVYSTGGYAGVYGSGYEGVWGATTSDNGDAIEADASGTSAWGLNAYTSGQSGHAVYGKADGVSARGGTFYSTQYTGLYTQGGAGYYDLYAPTSAYIGGSIIPPRGGLALLARNEGRRTLEIGDVAVFRGLDLLALGHGVVLAAEASASPGVVVGVVQGAYVVDEAAAAPAAIAEPAAPVLQEDTLVPPAPVPDGEEPRVEEDAAIPAAPAMPDHPSKSTLAEPVTGRFVEGKVEAGQYMVVSYEGLVLVKVTARNPIQAGDWIVVTPDGAVTGVPARSYSAALDRGCTILGRALEGLEKGPGTILVQLSLR